MNSADKLAAYIERGLEQGVEEFRWAFLCGPAAEDGLLDRAIAAAVLGIARAVGIRIHPDPAERDGHIRADVLGIALVGALGFRAAAKAVQWDLIQCGRASVVGEVARILGLPQDLLNEVRFRHSRATWQEERLTAREIACGLRLGEFGGLPKPAGTPPVSVPVHRQVVAQSGK